VLDAQNAARARNAALIAVMLSIALIFTAIANAALCNELTMWLLCAEAVALAATALVIRADLRPPQRHTVK